MHSQAPEAKGLFCRNIVKSYGKIEVLKSVNLSLRPGTVTAIIGENGAGKSTFNAIIAGVVAPVGGQMWIDGQAYTPNSPIDAISRGVALIHQEIRLLQELSVAENLFLGRLPMHNGRIDRKRMEIETRDVLATLGLKIDPRRKIRGLSMAVQQGIEIAKAILRKPRYVIFDEPTASLGEEDAKKIFAQIAKMKAEGTGIIYVSHRLEEIQTLADQVICLRDGMLVAEWQDMPVSKQDMINAMVGREFKFVHHAPKPSGQNVVLKVEKACRNGVFNEISFELMEGEILGFAGLIGAARTDVVRAIAGADSLDSGKIWVAGEQISIKSPVDAINKGVVMVPEDRKGLGLSLGLSAAENIILPWEKQMAKYGMVWPSDIKNIGHEQKQRFDIRGRMELPVSSMSGGNQQKVLLAKWLLKNPRIFIIDEPTRGVDVGAKMAIYQIIRNLAAQGIGVIVVSSELEEVMGLSHRILVMSDGKQRGILSREEASPERVMSLAFNH